MWPVRVTVIPAAKERRLKMFIFQVDVRVIDRCSYDLCARSSLTKLKL
jgi:hypothetical protein